MKPLFRILISSCIPLALYGCASTAPLVTTRPHATPGGSYHTVSRGETLWSIAKHYRVSLDILSQANKLPDATKISVGQKLFIPGDSRTSSLPRTSYTPLSTSFAWPVAGNVISHFGEKKGLVSSKGIDIAAREGSYVVAAQGGVVSFIDENMKGLGKTIIIDHENGYSTVYAHNAEILVTPRQRVAQNERIAKVGTTGRAHTAFLHFQIRKGHEPQNPFHYLP